MKRIALFAATLLLALSSLAATADSRTILVLDGSGSMWGQIEQAHKIDIARKVIRKVLSETPDDQQLGLVAYGHNRKGDCSDIESLVPVGVNHTQILTAVEAINPKGKTPLSDAVVFAANQLRYEEQPATVILISDGIETCDADPCAVGRSLEASGVDFTAHVIGFDVVEPEAQAQLSCLAENTGGQYLSAANATELVDALQETVVEAAIPVSVPEADEPETGTRRYNLKIIGRDVAGEKLRFVKGTAVLDGEEPIDVNAEFNNWVEPGEYQLEVGVTTRSGEIFKPVRTTALVSQPGTTVVEITVNRPPTVSARFIEQGETIKGVSTVSAWQDGEEVFRFRHKDEVFVMPGTYEFRAKPNADNDLRQTVTVNEGADTELVWELANTVSIYVTYVLPGGEVVKQNAKLWQDGKHVYSLHAHNKKLVRPGTYEVHTAKKLISSVVENFEVGNEENRTYEIPLEAGYLVVSFDPAAEYKRNPDRAVVKSKTGPGRRTSVSPGTAVPATPGEYTVMAPAYIGNFDDIVVTIVKGETTEVILTPKGL